MSCSERTLLGCWRFVQKHGWLGGIIGAPLLLPAFLARLEEPPVHGHTKDFFSVKGGCVIENVIPINIRACILHCAPNEPLEAREYSCDYYLDVHLRALDDGIGSNKSYHYNPYLGRIFVGRVGCEDERILEHEKMFLANTSMPCWRPRVHPVPIYYRYRCQCGNASQCDTQNCAVLDDPGKLLLQKRAGYDRDRLISTCAIIIATVLIFMACVSLMNQFGCATCAPFQGLQRQLELQELQEEQELSSLIVEAAAEVHSEQDCEMLRQSTACPRNADSSSLLVFGRPVGEARLGSLLD